VTAPTGRWTSTGRLPAKYESVKQALLGVADLQAPAGEDRKPELYGKLGLAEPEKPGSDSVLLTLTGGQGSALAAVVVGHRGSDNGTVYVRRAGDSQAGSRRATSRRSARPRSGWIRDIIKLPSTRVQTVTITHPEGDKAVVSREKVDDKDWTIQDVPADSEPKSAGLARSIAVALESLSFDDVASAEKSAAARRRPHHRRLRHLRRPARHRHHGCPARTRRCWRRSRPRPRTAANDTVKTEAKTLQDHLSPWVFTIPRLPRGEHAQAPRRPDQGSRALPPRRAPHRAPPHRPAARPATTPKPATSRTSTVISRPSPTRPRRAHAGHHTRTRKRRRPELQRRRRPSPSPHRRPLPRRRLRIRPPAPAPTPEPKPATGGSGSR